MMGAGKGVDGCEGVDDEAGRYRPTQVTCSGGWIARDQHQPYGAFFGEAAKQEGGSGDPSAWRVGNDDVDVSQAQVLVDEGPPGIDDHAEEGGVVSQVLQGPLIALDGLDDGSGPSQRQGEMAGTSKELEEAPTVDVAGTSDHGVADGRSPKARRLGEGERR